MFRDFVVTTAYCTKSPYRQAWISHDPTCKGLGQIGGVTLTTQSKTQKTMFQDNYFHIHFQHTINPNLLQQLYDKIMKMHFIFSDGGHTQKNIQKICLSECEYVCMIERAKKRWGAVRACVMKGQRDTVFKAKVIPTGLIHLALSQADIK